MEDGTLDSELISGFASGSEFPIGSTPVTYGSSDSDGNLSSCSFEVTVIDMESPVVNCPDDITVGVAMGQTEAVVEYEVGATDNCSPINPKDEMI